MALPWLLLTNSNRDVVDKPTGCSIEVRIDCIEPKAHPHCALPWQWKAAGDPLPLNADQLAGYLPIPAINAHFHYFAIPIGCWILRLVPGLEA